MSDVPPRYTNIAAGNSVNIWNLLWLSRRLIICTEQTSIYISTFSNALTSEWAKNHQLRIQLFRQRLSHKRVKVYATMLIGIMGSKSLALLE